MAQPFVRVQEMQMYLMMQQSCIQLKTRYEKVDHIPMRCSFSLISIEFAKMNEHTFCYVHTH